MSLDITLMAVRPTEIYSGNITHNLTKMADEAGIYKHLWRPEELGIKTAEELIEPLREGLARLLESPEHFRQFNPPNKWGDYDAFVRFVDNYLSACEANPDATISVSR